MNDARNFATEQGGYINPVFSTYGTPLAKQLTNWLYADRTSNPAWDQESQWARVGRVAYLDRTVAITSLATGTSTVSTVNLGGGKNIVVFSRQATVRFTTPPGTMLVLPNQISSYVNVEIQRQSGFIDVEDAPIANNFGSGNEPFIRPSPELWLGNETRQFTFTNNSGSTVDVSLTFQIALLDTGR